jgi:hypothetical protein
MTGNPRRIEQIPFYCCACWHRGTLNVEWKALEGKTLEDLRIMCQDAHKQQCPKADVRLRSATKTRRTR